MLKPWGGFASNWRIWMTSVEVSPKPERWVRPLSRWTGTCGVRMSLQLLQTNAATDAGPLYTGYLASVISYTALDYYCEQ